MARLALAVLLVTIEGDLAHAQAAPKPRLTARVGAAVRTGARRVKENPGKALTLSLGTAAMFLTGIYVSPEVGHQVAALTDPHLGRTAAEVLGTAVGGALASGSRSLLVFSTPMVIGVDPVNRKQLATDVGLSAGFGFIGFAQAATLNTVVDGSGAGPIGRAALLLGGLVGWEMAKDFVQMKIRNRYATVPKRFRDVWKELLVMETLSNAHRIFFPTSFVAKQLGDLGGGFVYDRILNSRHIGDVKRTRWAP